jgi:hypothetical protein
VTDILKFSYICGTEQGQGAVYVVTVLPASCGLRAVGDERVMHIQEMATLAYLEDAVTLQGPTTKR